ncbi:hypothetical protein [Aquiflexum sp.]|uniref:hypothetical protein n=1 Tax=Aquiflexum sp. TaxID=1872584 RepID=UPI00359402D2
MKKFEDFTVNEIIIADFRASTVFRRFGVDPILNKEKMIKEVCVSFDLNPDTILDRIIEEMEVNVPKPFKMTA